MGRLQEHVDWYYLLREFWEIYRFNSAGGSKPIRAHKREVRNRLSDEIERNPDISLPQPASLPACTWLGRAVDEGLADRCAPLLRALNRVLGGLCWEYGYQRMPPGLKPKFGFAKLMSPQGPVISQQLTLGLVIFAPHCTYPAHSHDGICESYICLSGMLSENDAGVYAPGSLIFNPPSQSHRITTGDFEPTLLAYAWVGPAEKLAHQHMRFSRRSSRS